MLVNLGRDLKNVGIDLLLLTSSGKVLSKSHPEVILLLLPQQRLSPLAHAYLILLPAEEAGEIYHCSSVSLLAVFP